LEAFIGGRVFTGKLFSACGIQNSVYIADQYPTKIIKQSKYLFCILINRKEMPCTGEDFLEQGLNVPKHIDAAETQWEG
jgi:hypothetical protein